MPLGHPCPGYPLGPTSWNSQEGSDTTEGADDLWVTSGNELEPNEVPSGSVGIFYLSHPSLSSADQIGA